MSATEANDSSIYGGPTKRFFVSMLTRDIDLDDAILDLIDNSVDGAIRQTHAKAFSPSPFTGFEAKLTLDAKSFKLTDNCGGIPDEFLADAFSLGRPSLDKDGDIPTIGMYGIGMKRAVFKIAKCAEITSIHPDISASVEYSRDWLSPENMSWDLGRVDKRDSHLPRVLIQGCFLRSSHGSWGFVGCGMGADRAAVAA